MPVRPLRIAHRGVPRRAPENTLPSFALALELGADGLELDVHATRDGVVVVHHDPTLRRGPAIADLRYSDLGTHEVATGVPIPTLAEVCELVAGRAELFVELKGAFVEDLVVNALADYSGPVAIHSFDFVMIGRLRDLQTPYSLGLLFEEDSSRVVEAMEDFGASDVWPSYVLVDAPLVEAVHARGGRVIPWTVNDAKHAERLALLGVDGLCGDDVSIFPGREA